MNLVDKLSLIVLILTLGAQILYRRSFWFTRIAETRTAKAEEDPSFATGQAPLSGPGRILQVPHKNFKNYVKGYFSKRENFSGFLRVVWIISILAIFGLLTYWAVLQYKLWGSSELTKHLLPPYRSFGYFYSYVGKRLFAPWFISLVFALVVSRTAKRLNKRFGERFFEREEIELISLGIFLTGYPGFFIYLTLVLLLAVLASAFFTLLNFSSEKLGRASSLFSKGRLPLYYFWIPLAILAMIIKIWLFPALGWQYFLGQFAI